MLKRLRHAWRLDFTVTYIVWKYKTKAHTGTNMHILSTMVWHPTQTTIKVHIRKHYIHGPRGAKTVILNTKNKYSHICFLDCLDQLVTYYTLINSYIFFERSCYLYRMKWEQETINTRTWRFPGSKSLSTRDCNSA